MKRKVRLPSKDRIRLPKNRLRLPPKKRYVIQRVIEDEGKELEYIDIYEDNVAPFDLHHRDFIGNQLLKRFGPGRYVIKSTDPRTKKLTIQYSGEVEHPTKGKIWTKKERYEYTRIRNSTNKLKLTTTGYFSGIAIFLVAIFVYSIYTINVPLAFTSIIVIIAFLVISLVFMSNAFYETE
jgi:hypothetical protein